MAIKNAKHADIKEARSGASETATLNTELQKLNVGMSNIGRGVDDIRIDIRAQRDQMIALQERITRVEESTKQAHKRMDRIDPASAKPIAD